MNVWTSECAVQGKLGEQVSARRCEGVRAKGGKVCSKEGKKCLYAAGWVGAGGAVGMICFERGK